MDQGERGGRRQVRREGRTVTGRRWLIAQTYERDYWEAWGSGIASGSIPQLRWYRWRADQLVRRLAEAGLDSLLAGQLRVLEVGGGPVGIAGFLPAAEIVLIDPLEVFYAAHPLLSKLRNPAAIYRSGIGEALPAESARYDLVILDNCLDHVRDVDGVLSEIRRVLGPAGLLYLTVNCRSRPGYVIHRMLSALRLDPGHPHTFTRASAERSLCAHGFVPVLRECDSFLQAWRADLRSRRPVPVLKAVLGVSEFLTTLLARRG